MRSNEPLAHLIRPHDHIPHGFGTTLQSIQHADKFNLKKRVQVLMPAIAHQRSLVTHALKVDFAPAPGHVAQLLRVGHYGCEGLRHLVDVEESEDKVPEARTELNFGLDKGVAVALEGVEDETLHLVGELAKASEDMRWDGYEELRS